jgi:hypothetical protein
MGLSPAGFLDEARSHPDALERRLVRYATSLQQRGRRGTYIAKTFTGAGSFLRKHRVEFAGFPKVKMVRGESIESERVPTQAELGKLLRALSLRGQVSALLMAHAGLRPGTFATYLAGDRALSLRDLPELDLKSLSFRRMPFQIRVPGSLSKTRRAYLTFGTPELGDALIAYLKERKRRPRWSQGHETPPETLTPESPVVAIRDTETDTGFVTVKAVTAELRNAIAKVVPNDTTWRPYVLRAYASTQLLLAESKGLIIRDVREEILGHDLGVSGRYNLEKKLSGTLVEELREQYARAVPFLESGGGQRVDRATLMADVLSAILRRDGVAEDEVSRIRAKVLDGTFEGGDIADILPSKKAEPVQKLVPLTELRSALSEGWEFLSVVGADQVVVRSLGSQTHISAPRTVPPNDATGHEPTTGGPTARPLTSER